MKLSTRTYQPLIGKSFDAPSLTFTSKYTTLTHSKQHLFLVYSLMSSSHHIFYACPAHHHPLLEGRPNQDPFSSIPNNNTTTSYPYPSLPPSYRFSAILFWLAEILTTISIMLSISFAIIYYTLNHMPQKFNISIHVPT